MKVKIKNDKLKDFDKEFKVRRINYDQVVVSYPNKKMMEVFKNSDIEFITESEIDTFLIEHKDFLKIKLNRGISVVLYKNLLEGIEEEINDKFISLDLLKDKYNVNKRGVWEKELVILINNKFAMQVLANGQNFKKNSINLDIKMLEKENFIEVCNEEIRKINSKIEESQRKISFVLEALDKVNKPNDKLLN